MMVELGFDWRKVMGNKSDSHWLLLGVNHVLMLQTNRSLIFFKVGLGFYLPFIKFKKNKFLRGIIGGFFSSLITVRDIIIPCWLLISSV